MCIRDSLDSLHNFTSNSNPSDILTDVIGPHVEPIMVHTSTQRLCDYTSSSASGHEDLVEDENSQINSVSSLDLPDAEAQVFLQKYDMTLLATGRRLSPPLALDQNLRRELAETIRKIHDRIMNG